MSTQPEGVPAPSGDAAEASTPDVTIRGVVTGASVSYDPATGLPTEHVQITIDPVAVNANIREQMRRSEVVRALRRPAGPNPLPDTEIGLANGSVMRAAADVPAADRIRGTAANAVIVDYVDDSHTGLTLAQTQAVQDSFTNPQPVTPHAAASERLLDSLADPADTGNAAAMAAINAYQRDRMQHGRAVRAAVARVLSNVDVPQLARTLEPDAMADVAGYVALGMSGDVAAAADVAAVRERMRQYMMRQDPAEFARQYTNRPAVGPQLADYAAFERAMLVRARDNGPNMEDTRARGYATTHLVAQQSMADRLAAMTPRQRQMFLFGLPYGRNTDSDGADREVPAQAAADVPRRADTQERSIAVNHNRRTPRRRPQPAADATPAAPQPPVVHIRQRPRRPGQVPQLVLTPDEPEAPVVPYDVPQVPVDWQPPRALLPALLAELWGIAASFDTGAAALGITFNPVGAYQVFGLWCADAVNRWLSAPSHSDYTYGVEFVRQAFRNSERGGPEIHERCAPVAQLLAMYPLLCAGRPEGDRTRDYALYASAAVVARILIVETQAVLVVAPNPGGIPHRAVDWDATDAEAASNASTGLVASWSTDVDAVHGVPCSMATHWVHRAAGLEPDVEARIVQHMQAVPRVTRPYIVPGIDNRLATLLIEIPAQAVARRSPPYRLFCGSDGHPIACGRPAQPATGGQDVPPSAYQPSATTLAGLAEELRISHSSVRRRAWSAFQAVFTVQAAPVQPSVPPSARIAQERESAMYAIRVLCDSTHNLNHAAIAVWWGPTGLWRYCYPAESAELRDLLAGRLTAARRDTGPALATVLESIRSAPSGYTDDVASATRMSEWLSSLAAVPLLSTTAVPGIRGDAGDLLYSDGASRVAYMLRSGPYAILLCGNTTARVERFDINWNRPGQSSPHNAVWTDGSRNVALRSPPAPRAWAGVAALLPDSAVWDHLQAHPTPPSADARSVRGAIGPLVELPARYFRDGSQQLYRLFASDDGVPVAAVPITGEPAPQVVHFSATEAAQLVEYLRVQGAGRRLAVLAAAAPAPAVNIGRRDDASMYATPRVAVGGAAVPSVPAPRQASVRAAVPEMLRYFCDQARDLAYGATAIWWGLTDSSWHCRYLTADDALAAVLDGGTHQANGLDGLDAAARAVVAALPQSRVPETSRASEYDSYLTALGRQPLLHATTLAADQDADQALLFRRGTRVAWLLRAGSHIVLLCGHTDTPGPDAEIAWGRVVPRDSAEWSYDVADLTFGSTIDPGVTRQEHTTADVSRLMDYLRASPAPPVTNIRPVPDIDPPMFELPAQYLRNGRRLGLFATEHGVLVAAASSESNVWLLTAAEAARVTEQLRCMWAPARALASDRAGRRPAVDINGEPIPVPTERWVAWDSAAVDRAWRTAFHHDTPAPVTGVGDVVTRTPAVPSPSAVDNSRAAVPLWLDFLAAHCTARGSAVAAWWSPTGAWSCGWLPAGAALQRVLSGACDNGDRQHVWQALCNIDARSQRTLAHSGAVGLVNCLNALGHHPLLGVALTADPPSDSVNLPLYRNGRNVARVVLCGSAAVLLCGTDASDADNRPLDWAAYDASPRAFSTDNVRASWVGAAWRHNVNVADLDIAASTTALHGWQTQFQALDHAAVLTAYIRDNPTGSDTPRSVPNTTPPLTELPAVYYSSATPDAHRVLAAPDGTPVFAIRLMAHDSGSLCSLTLRQSAEVAEALRTHSHARRSSLPDAARTYSLAAVAALRGEAAVDNAGENEDAGVLSGAVVSTENRTAVPMLLRFLCGHAPEGGALVAWWGLTGEWCYQTLPASDVLDALLDNEHSCDPTTLREVAGRLQMLQGQPSSALSGSFVHTVRRCLDVLGRHPLLAVAVHGYYDDRLQIPQFAVDHGDVDVNSYPLYRVGRRVARIVRCGATAVLLCAERTTLAPDRPLAWDAHDTNRAEEAGEYGAATWTATARFGPWGVPAAVGGPGHQRAQRIPVSRILEYLAANPAPADLFNRPVAGTTPQLIELPARILAGSPLAPHRLFATHDGTPVCVTPLNPTPNPHEVNYLSAAESARAAEQLRTTMRRAVAPPAPAGVAAARTAAMTGMISIDEALAANPNLGDLSYLPAPRTNAAQPAPPVIDLDGSFRARAYALGWRPSAAVQNEAEATAEAGAWVASHMRVDPLLAVPVTRAPVADAPFSGVIQNSWGVPLVPTGHIHTYRSAAAGALPPPSPDGWLDPAQRIDDAAEAARQLIASVPVQLTAHQLGITDPVPIGITTGQLTYAAGGLISNPGYMYAPRTVSRPQIPTAPVVDDNNSNVGQPLLITELARAALPRLFDLVWASAVQSGNAHAVLWYGPTGRYGLKYFPESANLRWVTSADREHYQARRNLYDAEVGTWSTEAQRLELDHCLTVLAAYPLWNMVSGRIGDRCVLVRDDYAVRLVASSDDLGSGYVIIVGPAELASPPRPINWERAQNRWGLAESYTAGWNGAPPVPSEYDVPHPDLLSPHISRSHRTQNIVDLALYLRDVPTTPTRVLNTSGLFTGYVSGSLSELPASLITRRDPAERWRLFSDRAGLPTFAGRIVNDRPVIDDLTPSAARHLGEMLRVTNPNVYQHLYGNVVTLLGQPS